MNRVLSLIDILRASHLGHILCLHVPCLHRDHEGRESVSNSFLISSQVLPYGCRILDHLANRTHTELFRHQRQYEF